MSRGGGGLAPRKCEIFAFYEFLSVAGLPWRPLIGPANPAESTRTKRVARCKMGYIKKIRCVAMELYSAFF